MKKMTSAEIKAEEVRILQDVHRFCQERGIAYSVSGGTLLGAVRHKGFIPWDDDIDLMMPRKEYETFLQTYTGGSDFVVTHYTTDPNYPYPFAKVCSRRTFLPESCLETRFQIANAGIWVDIFPIDYIENPSNPFLWYRLKRYRMMQRYVAYHRDPPKNFFHRKWKEFFVPRLRKRYPTPAPLMKEIDDFAMSQAKEPTPLMACMVWGYGKKEVVSSSLWDNLIEYPFEDTKVMGYANCDAYLKSLYGDYMTPPPENKRAPLHSITAYWRE